MENWNPWHGCKKISPGCKNCYVYRGDSRYERDASEVKKNLSFDLPIKKNKKGEYVLPAGSVFCCGTSDFFLDEADEWRKDAWRYIKERPDINFLIITKRIHRFEVSLPDDWGEGYENVAIGCTCENQDRADYRLPIFLSLPIKRRYIICEPLLEKVSLYKYLDKQKISLVLAGGESGNLARLCDYDWILALREEAKTAGIPFHFKQTGAYFKKGNKVYKIPRKLQHAQARKANLNT